MKSIGIDGCRSGWISVSSDMEVLRFETISDVVKYYGENGRYFIDIPIGLASQSNTERTCEKLMRNILNGHRKSSVFGVPCREALEASTFEDANNINRLILGKGVSKQSFFIFNKIKQVDVFLRSHHFDRLNINESHPEITFHFLNDGTSMKFNKKTQKGLEERLDVLERYDDRVKAVFHNSVSKFLRKDVSKDDILDAMCLAIAGSNLPNRVLKSLPQEKETDVYGLQMGVFYNSKANKNY